jgi:CBS domain-containing protein
VRGDFLRVKEIMDSKHPSIYEDDPATKARALLRDLNLRIIPVTDENKKLLGKISRRDVMTISSSVSPMKAKGIMTPARYVAMLDEDVPSAFRGMLRVDVWYAPVTVSSGDRTYKGVVGLESFIETLMKNSPERFVKDVSDIMTKDVVTCSPDDEVDKIWRLMNETRFAGLPVVKNGKLVGMVTQKDLLETGVVLPAFESRKGRFRESPKISSVMQTNLIAVPPSTKAIRVARVMVSKDIGRVPVKDKDGKLVGIVDREDIARLVVG